jgi:hypothetical protein
MERYRSQQLQAGTEAGRQKAGKEAYRLSGSEWNAETTILLPKRVVEFLTKFT